MTDHTEELLNCPLCGAPAKADNGFAPCESITYAFCMSRECPLSSVDVGITTDVWNQRAAQKVDPNPPQVSITWHESPESVHRAMWEESAIDAGLTYEQMLAESAACGEDEHGNEIEFTHEQELDGMRQQGCWGFVDSRTNIIHAWAADSAPRGFILHMLAHEIGHVTGEPHPDELQEEMRAEQFGRVAKLAYELLPQDRYDYQTLAAEHERLQQHIAALDAENERLRGTPAQEVRQDHGDITLTPDAAKILTECIGAHAYVLQALVNGRPDLALTEAKKWVDGFKEAADHHRQAQRQGDSHE